MKTFSRYLTAGFAFTAAYALVWQHDLIGTAVLLALSLAFALYAYGWRAVGRALFVTPLIWIGRGLVALLDSPFFFLWLISTLIDE